MGLGQYADDAVRANANGRGGDLQIYWLARNGYKHVLMTNPVYFFPAPLLSLQLTWQDPGLPKLQLSSMTLSSF